MPLTEMSGRVPGVVLLPGQACRSYIEEASRGALYEGPGNFEKYQECRDLFQPTMRLYP